MFSKIKSRHNLQWELELVVERWLPIRFTPLCNLNAITTSIFKKYKQRGESLTDYAHLENWNQLLIAIVNSH